MELVDKNALDIFSIKIHGGFATIYKCLFNDKYYAYKKFENQSYFSAIVKKIESLGTLSLQQSFLPKKMVIDENKEEISYLTEWSNYQSMSYLYYHDNILDNVSNKIKILKNVRNNIIELHDNGIIHGDIHMGNIMVNDENLNTKLIDFDNCNYKNFILNPKYAVDIVKAYVAKYGMNKELDIFLLNHLTLELLYNIGYENFDEEINFMYGEFKYDSEVKHIVDTLLFMSNKPAGEFLIDTYFVKRLER